MSFLESYCLLEVSEVTLRKIYETRHEGKLRAEAYAGPGFCAEMDSDSLHLSCEYLPQGDVDVPYVTFRKCEFDQLWKMFGQADKLRQDGVSAARLEHGGIEFIIGSERLCIVRRDCLPSVYVTFDYEDVNLIRDAMFLCSAREQFYRD